MYFLKQVMFRQFENLEQGFFKAVYLTAQPHPGVLKESKLLSDESDTFREISGRGGGGDYAKLEAGGPWLEFQESISEPLQLPHVHIHNDRIKYGCKITQHSL